MAHRLLRKVEPKATAEPQVPAAGPARHHQARPVQQRDPQPAGRALVPAELEVLVAGRQQVGELERVQLLLSLAGGGSVAGQ